MRRWKRDRKAWPRGLHASLAAGMLLAAPAWAQEVRPPVDVHALGPQVGEAIPDFRLPDQNGRVWTRDTLLGPNGALILFHRSADW